MEIEFKDISHGTDVKGKTFDHHCILEVKTTEDNGSVTETKEQGYMVQGKDAIFLNAPKIYPPQDPDLLPDGKYTPLLTEAQDFVGAINELFLSGAGGGDVFIVSGSESGITVTMVKNRGEDQELTSEFFSFVTKTYKTITTLSAGNTSIEKTWSKTVITEVLKDGETVWDFELDSSGGVTAVFDSVGNDVLNGITGEEGESVLTATPEGIALGWALAYNKVQDDALKKILDAYQDGIDDCDKINEAEGGNGNGGGDGDGNEPGGDGTGSGSGGEGDGGGSGGIKLPQKHLEEMELPDGKGCLLTYEVHNGYQITYVTEYCDYAVIGRTISGGMQITRYDVYQQKNYNGNIQHEKADMLGGPFSPLSGIFNVRISGDYQDPDGVYHKS